MDPILQAHLSLIAKDPMSLEEQDRDRLCLIGLGIGNACPPLSTVCCRTTIGGWGGQPSLVLERILTFGAL